MGTKHASELQLLNHAVGREVAAAIRGHIDGCQECQGRLQELVAEKRSFAPVLPPERVLTLFEERRQQQAGGRWQVQLLRWAPAAALGLLLVVAVPHWRGESNGTRLKGSLTVQLYVKRGEIVIPAPSDFVFQRGDLVRLGIQSPFQADLTVMTGNPPDSRPIPKLTDFPLPAGEEVVLPGSLALGCENGSERVDLRLVGRSGAEAPLVKTLVLRCSP